MNLSNKTGKARKKVGLLLLVEQEQGGIEFEYEKTVR